MHIVQVVKNFPPAIGGVENYVYSLSLEMSKLGHKVSVITSKGVKKNEKHARNVDRKLCMQGVKVYRLNILPTGVSSHLINSHYTFLMPSLISKLLSINADIIHAHSFPALHTDISALLSWLRSLPLIISIHGLCKPHRLYSSLIGKKVISISRRVVVNNPYQSDLLRRMGIKDDKIRVIPPGINVERFQNCDNSSKDRKTLKEKIILFVGRIVKGKGLEYLVKAAPKVLRHFPESKFVIVGRDYGFAKHLKRLIARKGITSHFIFTGSKRGHDLVETYYSCDVFVLPSEHEGFGLAALEAMTCGKPVVITDYEGASWFKQSGACFIVKRGDAKALAQSLITILSNEKLAEKMSERAKFFAQKFDWSSISRKVENLYFEVVNSKH